MNNKVVHVVGAGFTGLVCAYYLVKKGFKVEVFEKSDHSGGLIRTVETPWGLCETAANGIINSSLLEELAADINVPLIGSRPESRRRFIFREQPRRWPLSPQETVMTMSKFSWARPKRPQINETIEEWGKRVLGRAATEYLLAPALQGIYAGDPKHLSAFLIMSRFFKKRPQKNRPKLRGTVSPRGGMGELILGLESYLREKEVIFHDQTSYELGGMGDLGSPGARVICTSSRSAGEILYPLSAELGQALKSVEMLGLISVTAFFPKEAGSLRGFGVLFPRDQGFRALGVLFNNFIFEGRSSCQSETWILGGASDPDIFKLKDTEIVSLICSERDMLYKNPVLKNTAPLGYRVQRWPEALPHYTVGLERTLRAQEEEIRILENRKIFLLGNYGGTLSLSRILERASLLPQRLR